MRAGTAAGGPPAGRVRVAVPPDTATLFVRATDSANSSARTRPPTTSSNDRDQRAAIIRDLLDLPHPIGHPSRPGPGLFHLVKACARKWRCTAVRSPEPVQHMLEVSRAM